MASWRRKMCLLALFSGGGRPLPLAPQLGKNKIRLFYRYDHSCIPKWDLKKRVQLKAGVSIWGELIAYVQNEQANVCPSPNLDQWHLVLTVSQPAAPWGFLLVRSPSHRYLCCGEKNKRDARPFEMQFLWTSALGSFWYKGSAIMEANRCLTYNGIKAGLGVELTSNE